MSGSSAAPLPGTITWTEIPVQDVHRARNFYKDVFGWEYTTPYSNNPKTGEKNVEPDFWGFQKGSCHGSFRKVEPVHHLSAGRDPDNANKQKLAVTVTIVTESIEESMEAIEKAGGSAYSPKRPVGEDGGFVMKFLDSEKNVMGLWAMH